MEYGQERAQECLDAFLKKVKQQKTYIETVAMDMWFAYIGSALEYSPDSHIVFDQFHIIKKLNEAVSNVRKALFHQEADLNKILDLHTSREALI